MSQIKKLINQKFLEGIDSTKFHVAQNGAIMAKDSSGAMVEFLKVNSDSKGVVLGKVISTKDELDAVIADLAAEVLARESGDTFTLNSAKSYADQKIADLVNGAPQLLDTLKELADAIGNDENFAVSVANQVAAVQAALNAEIARAQGEENALKSRMTTAEGDIDALEGRMSTAEGDIDVLEGRMSSAEGRLNAVEPKVTTLEGEMDEAQADIGALEGRMTTAESDIDALEMEMGLAKGRLDVLEDDMASAKQDIQELYQDKADVSYVNSQDALKLQEAKDYADAQDEVVLSDAKSYADVQDAVKLIEAKNYADTKDAEKLLEAKQYASDQDALKLQEAKDYADAKDELKVSKSGDSMTGALNFTLPVDWDPARTSHIEIKSGNIKVDVLTPNPQDSSYTANLNPDGIIFQEQSQDFSQSFEYLIDRVKYNSSGYGYSDTLHLDSTRLTGAQTNPNNVVRSFESSIEGFTHYIDNGSGRQPVMPTVDYQMTPKKYVDDQDAAKIQEAKAYADAAVLVEKERAESAEAGLQSAINVEKGRVDAILDASQADKDSFAEIVALINSVDLENDNALAAVILAEQNARQAGDDALDARLDIVEPKVTSLESRMSTAESDIDSLEGRVSSAEGEISGLKTRMTSAESSISNLSSIKADKSYVDSQDAGLQSQIDALDGRMDTAESNISSLSSTKADKSYVDAQIAAAQANLDDVEGFAQDIRDDLDAEIVRAQAAESALDVRLDALEGLAFYKENKVVTASELSSFDLAKEAKPNSIKVFVGRLALHEGQDFSVSVVGGKSRLTWMGDFMVGGVEEIEEGMKLFFEYYC